MNLIRLIIKQSLVVTLLLLANISVGQASAVSYNVEGVLYEPLKFTGGTVGDTIFSGSFVWDSSTSTLSGFSGVMNSSMVSMEQDISLAYNLATTISGNVVTASVFKEQTTNVFFGGGYATRDVVGLGHSGDTFSKNRNAYFTFAFDKTTMDGIVDAMVYGDCTDNGMMGSICMTGIEPYTREDGRFIMGGTMGATPESLSITEVSSVPVPAAVWLFGTAIAGLLGVSRKRVLAA